MQSLSRHANYNMILAENGELKIANRNLVAKKTAFVAGFGKSILLLECIGNLVV